ncbi:hypothetical protein FOCC_FOCC017558 [Frankliniella occidentalis]|nr:hypothetical protein FOCC_FOCC017558 [Frankliniella occidentalis]
MSLRDDLDLPDGDGVAVGIDLGTTYSVVGVCRRRKVEILANDNGSRTTPSIVGFLDGQSFVGDAAKDLPAANQVFDAKRLVGRQWSDRSIQEDKSVWPFEVEEHGGVPRIRVKIGERNDTFAPEEDLKKTLTAAKKKTLMQDKQAMQDLRQACELVKRKLSTVPQAPLSVFLSRLNKGYQTTISRSLFENVCSSLFLKTIQVSEKVLTDAKVTRGDIDEVVLVGGSTRIPKVRALLRDMFGGKELRQSINPDEAVAYGAAVHAAVLTGDKFFDGMVKLRDVTPLSLGVFSVGGKFSRVIKRNTPIPCKNTRTYVTFEDNQLELGSKIYQGERPLVKDNYYLNKEYRIAVPRLPAGQAKTDVTFEIDASGLLTVTCVETTSGRQVQVRVTPQEAYLSEDDIQAMIEKARRLRREDQDALREVNEDIQRKRQRLS